MQIQYCRDIERVHFGKAPRIGAMVAAYGRNTAESWMICQLNDLSLFAGCKEKLTPRQIEETAAMMVESYPHYNLTEFMLFFQRFKRCQYGRFYGAVDPMIIMAALNDFNDERRHEYIKRENEERQRERAAADAEHEALRQRYMKRVPNAFTGFAVINFLQYRLLGYDSMPDEQLNEEIKDLQEGRKLIPVKVTEMLNTIKHTFEINEQ